MKIGIIGTPGSGKTELAEYIQGEISPSYHYPIVDKYVEAFSDRTNIAIAEAGSHYANSAIAVERINKELQARTDFYITCGTLIETMAYDAVYGLPVTNQITERVRVQSMMQWFGILFTESFTYNKIFYLPPKLEEWKDLDYQIRYAIALFSVKKTDILEDDYSEVIPEIKDLQKKIDEITKTEQ